MSSGKRWRCRVCGYVHQGPEPPEACPVCGVSASEFDQLEDKAEAPAAGDLMELNGLASGSHVVVVGSGIAGLAAAEAARAADSSVRVTLLGRERELPYYRLNLTRFLAGELEREQLPIKAESWYAEQNIDLQQGVELRAIDVKAKKLQLAGGNHLDYDRLILCTGAHPFVPPVPGGQRACVSGLRSIEDAESIRAEAQAGARCVVVGGGLLGLEVAGALVRRGCRVELVEGLSYLLPRQLTPRAAELLAGRVNELGIAVHTSETLAEVQGDERVSAVRLISGKLLEADLVIMAAGVRPNSFLARRAGLQVENGLVVDHQMCTSHPDIFAAGDLVEHAGVLYGLWGPALFQGRIAGMNAVGRPAAFGGIPHSSLLKVLGVELFSIGVIGGATGRYLVFDHEQDDRYYRFAFRDKRLEGAVLLGDTGLSQRVKAAIESGEDFSEMLGDGPQAAEVIERLKA